MRNPFARKRTERRAVAFSDAVANALYSEATVAASLGGRQTGALEACAGLWARAFAGCAVSTESLTPDLMAIVARELVRRGEALLVIEAGADGVMLVPAASWDVRGVSIEESRWRYRCYMQGPERTTTRYVSGDMVLHFRYGVEASRPWLGRSPMAAAAATGALMGSLEAKLGQEAAGVVAHVLPIPVDPGEKEGADGDDFDPLADLKQGIRDAKGSTMFAETTASGWKQGKTEAPQQDWTPKRIGANPPDVLHLLRQAVEESVAIACGVPPSLLGSGEATAIREAWRMFVVATINPMLRSLRAQTRMKLDPSCVMSSDELIGVDQRARVFGSLKASDQGLSAADAARVAGIRL